MDVREKLVELSDIQVLQREIECVKRKSYTNCTDCLNCDLLMKDERILSAYANAIDALKNANGVTVQEWVSVDDRLPQYTDEYNVTVGVPSEFGYFEKVKTLRFERIKGKEPRWVIPKNEIYNVIAWMELPKKYKSPKGE